MAFKLKSLEGRLGEIIHSVTADRPMVLTYDDGEGTQIWREQGCVYIEDLGVDIYSAVACVYNKETDEYETDTDLFLFYEHGTTDPDSEVHNEWGSTLSVCVHNYAHYSGRDDLASMDAIENLGCVYLLNWHYELK